MTVIAPVFLSPIFLPSFYLSCFSYRASLSEKTRFGWRRQNRLAFRQQFLTSLPESHGQRSFRPSFSASSLSPWTMRTPLLTWDSDGNPLRRLLIVSKKMAVHRILRWTWHTVHSGVMAQDNRPVTIDTADECRFARTVLGILTTQLNALERRRILHFTRNPVERVLQ